MLFNMWDMKNPSDSIKDFVEKHKLQDNIHPFLKEYLYGKPIEIDKVIESILTIVLICEQADTGHPTATACTGGDISENPEAKAFSDLADCMVEECERRNRELPPTQAVQTH